MPFQGLVFYLWWDVIARLGHVNGRRLGICWRCFEAIFW